MCMAAWGRRDASHPNRILFTGREYDKETGLYYYRARYYNPQIGRFLQTDPIGYTDGMNWYGYCRNNPVVFADPGGTEIMDYSITQDYDKDGKPSGLKVSFVHTNPGNEIVTSYLWFNSFENFVVFMASDTAISWGLTPQNGSLGWELAGVGDKWDGGVSNTSNRYAYWSVQALLKLGIFSPGEINAVEAAGVRINATGYIWCGDVVYRDDAKGNKLIDWSWSILTNAAIPSWTWVASPIAVLADELMHAVDDVICHNVPRPMDTYQKNVLDARGNQIFDQTTDALYAWNPQHYISLWKGVDPHIRNNWNRSYRVGPPGSRGTIGW